MKKINYTVVGLVISLILVLTANVLILIRYRQDTQRYESTIASLQAEVIRQRDDKDKIRNLWEQQAALSDKLVIAQTNLLNRIDDYRLEIKRSIRFVNTQPELLPTVSEDRLKNAESGIDTETKTLEEKTEENAKAKEDAKQTIDSLYINAGEEQNNRANPRNN